MDYMFTARHEVVVKCIQRFKRSSDPNFKRTDLNTVKDVCINHLNVVQKATRKHASNSTLYL